MRFEGVRALVTGASGPLGAATVMALGRKGAAVAGVSSRSAAGQASASEAFAQWGGRFVPLQADVADAREISRAVDAAAEQLGGLDLLVNVAGIDIEGILETVPVDEWDRVMAINARGVFLASVACLPHFRASGGGTIVNVAAASAHRCGVCMGAFAPSKAAVVSLTKQMALEWARDGVRVNAVSPGVFLTERNADMVSRNVERIAKIPLGRAGRIDEIVRPILFFAGEHSSYVTGQALIVDGGGAETWWLSD